MCGIVGVLNKKKEGNVLHSVKERFLRQKSRGIDGFGLITLDGEGKVKLDRMTELTDAYVHFAIRESHLALFHHRIPTSSDNTLDQTHPIFVSNKELDHDYYLMHNGIISNDDDMYDKHVALGYEYTTEFPAKQKGYVRFNDSESIAIEVARFIDGASKAIETKGSVAFICAQVDKKTGKMRRVYWGRNADNPLKILDTKEMMSLSSEGNGDVVKPNTLHWLDLNTGKKGNKPMLIPSSYSSTMIGFKLDDWDKPEEKERYEKWWEDHCKEKAEEGYVYDYRTKRWYKKGEKPVDTKSDTCPWGCDGYSDGTCGCHCASCVALCYEPGELAKAEVVSDDEPKSEDHEFDDLIESCEEIVYAFDYALTKEGITRDEALDSAWLVFRAKLSEYADDIEKKFLINKDQLALIPSDKKEETK